LAVEGNIRTTSRKIYSTASQYMKHTLREVTEMHYIPIQEKERWHDLE
jgi:hypothetical protein